MNYKQTGYSTAEVAQIFRVTPVTIIRWIDEGKLRARASSVIVPGKRRKIRIEREHIQEFLQQHRDNYDIELLRSFGVDVVDPSELPESVHQFWNGEKDPELDSLPHRVEDLDGAWADMFKEEAGDPVKAKTVRPEKIEAEYEEAMRGIKTYAESKMVTVPDQKQLAPRPAPCQVVCDGRIAVANVKKETALAIVTALLNDELCHLSEITIRTEAQHD